MEELMNKIRKWSNLYQFSFQFWGDNNNVYIYKDHVELHSAGGHLTIEEVLQAAIDYVERINPKQ